MSEAFEAIMKAEAEAKEIMAKAQQKAEAIKKDGEIEAQKTYEKTYNKEVENVKRRAKEIVEEAKASADKEAAKKARGAIDYSKAGKKVDAIAEEIVQKLIQFQI